MDRREARAIQAMMLMLAKERMAADRRSHWWRFWDRWWYDWSHDPAGAEESAVLNWVYWIFSLPWKIVVEGFDAQGVLEEEARARDFSDDALLVGDRGVDAARAEPRAPRRRRGQGG